LTPLAGDPGTALALSGRVALASTAYRPRTPEHDVLRRINCEHLETFLDRAASRRDGETLPGFVRREFEKCVTNPWTRFLFDDNFTSTVTLRELLRQEVLELRIGRISQHNAHSRTSVGTVPASLPRFSL
jgi:hypothetical protein